MRLNLASRIRMRVKSDIWDKNEVVSDIHNKNEVESGIWDKNEGGIWHLG